jgi:hypothetical protein
MWKPDLFTPVRQLVHWPVTTQFGARRNALLACTALAERRREHDDVEQFLSRVDPPSAALPQNPGHPDATVDLNTRVAR